MPKVSPHACSAHRHYQSLLPIVTHPGFVLGEIVVLVTERPAESTNAKPTNERTHENELVDDIVIHLYVPSVRAKCGAVQSEMFSAE